MDNEKNEKKDKLKDLALSRIDELEDVELDAISDEDLEDVAGGLCSIWCCSGTSTEIER